jgi:hypothetical protein
VLKDASPAEVEEGIGRAAHGDLYLDPSLAGGLASRMVAATGLAARSPASVSLCSSRSLSRTSTLGLAADLLPDARPGRAKAKVHGHDVPIPGFVPADRVLAVPAAPAWQAIAGRFGRNARVALIGPKTQKTKCARQDSNPRPAA